MIASFQVGIIRRILVLALSLGLLTACATKPEPGQFQVAQAGGSASLDIDVDPLEGLNRFLFAFNDFLDTIFIRPAAATYRVILPDVVRDSIRSFLRNLNTPVILANDLFQGSWDRAETTLTRFIINTTVGVGGLYDAADDMGYAYHDEDFGQTLGSYGVPGYPYLVLPLLGPSTGRDAVGTLVDSFLDPLTYFVDEEILLARRLTSGIDLRSRNIENLEELRRDSIDFYARIRSVYLQRRESEINNGEPSNDLPAPGLSWDETDDGQVSNVEQLRCRYACPN